MLENTLGRSPQRNKLEKENELSQLWGWTRVKIGISMKKGWVPAAQDTQRKKVWRGIASRAKLKVAAFEVAFEIMMLYEVTLRLEKPRRS